MNGAAHTSRPGSVAVAVVAAIGLAVIALLSNQIPLVLVMGGSGLVLAFGLQLRGGSRPAETALSTLLIPLAGAIELVGIGLILRPVLLSGGLPDQGTALLLSVLVGLGAMTATFGAASTLRAGLGEGATPSGVGSAFKSTLLFAGLVALLAGWNRLNDTTETTQLSELLSAVLRPVELSNPGHALLLIGGLLLAVGYLGRRASQALPLAELASHTHRQRVTTLKDSLIDVFGGILVVGLLLAGSVAAGMTSGVIENVLQDVPQISLVASGLIRNQFHWLLLLLVVVFGLLYLVLGLLEFATGRLADPIANALPGLAGPLLLIVAAGPLTQLLPRIRSAVPPTVATRIDELVTIVSPVGVVLLVYSGILATIAATMLLLIVFGMFGVVPRRSSGSALAGGGVGLGGVAIALAKGPTLALFGVIGLAVVAWDIGEQGVTAQTELGHGASSSIRVEAVHWAGSLGVAVIGTVLAWLGLRLLPYLPRVAESPYRLVALLGALLGLALLTGILRG